MKRVDPPRPDCRFYAALEGHYATRKKLHIKDPDTYDLAGRLALEGHSSSPTSMLAELSGGRVLPLLGPSASPVGEAFLFLSPPLLGRVFFLLLAFGGGVRLGVIGQ